MATNKKTTTKKPTTRKKSVRKTTTKKQLKKPVAKKAVVKTSFLKSKLLKRTLPANSKLSASVGRAKKTIQDLKSWNLTLGVIHAAQAITVVLISNGARLPVDVNYLTQNPATGGLDIATRAVADVPLAWVVALFFAMSAVAHFVVAGPWWQGYSKDLGRGINKARWIEYSVSASTMIIGIALLSGVGNLALLFCLFMLTFIMNMMGLVMELRNQNQKKVDWSPFYIGVIAGIVPWIVIGQYFVSNWLYSTSTPPTFVYFIYGSMLVLYSSFAVNMWLQYSKKGKWSDYLYGEKVYMFLSLVAKSALAWQIYAGTLR